MRLLNPLHHLIDFCYPRICAACDRSGGNGELCSSCLTELQNLADAPACNHCALPVAEHGSLCPHCLGEGLKPFEKVIRLGHFKDPIRHLVHQIKYHGHWSLAEYLAERLLLQEPVKGILTHTDLLIPVPLHPWRQMSRGYNQAEIIAKRLGKKSGTKVAHPLVRLKNTETQTHLHSKEKRFENLRDAFGLLSGRRIRGKHVILIDDVMTTGATLVSAAKTLREAEPASICAIVVAVADPRGRDFEAI